MVLLLVNFRIWPPSSDPISVSGLESSPGNPAGSQPDKGNHKPDSQLWMFAPYSLTVMSTVAARLTANRAIRGCH